ncbi:MAG: tetratricopeptide repeat protein [Bacteroidales bacterium]|nr:tetratricopeptide repeat protein [Bacteroidales bacterium]
MKNRIIACLSLLMLPLALIAQINTDQVLRVGQNALYFEDYMLSIQYFNRVIQSKPYLAQPYFLRAIAKINLEDYVGAEADASTAIELNPYLTDAWEVRGVARQNLGRDRDAISDYDHALELLPRNRQLLFNKALAQNGIEDYAGADSTFSALLTYYPGFDSGYLGRARLRLAQSDTTAAAEDIAKALSINRNAVNGYIMRADIAINRDDDLKGALADMDEAVKLQPRMAGLYINRAYLRYRLDDYFGAMADFDYAIQLDPINRTALFNRGLLLIEAGANDKALNDFTRVIDLDPNDYRALYNRALINRNKGRYAEAVADINRVIEAFPDLPNGYYIRGEIYRDMNDLTRARRDIERGRQLARNAEAYDAPETPSERPGDEMPSDEAARQFATLLTVDDNADIHEEYNNTAIRGKVQDRNLQIEPEGWIELSYYSSPSELRPGGYYIKEVDDINATRVLRFVITVTPSVPVADEAVSSRHFQSIDYYNSYLSSHTPRAIDYLGRALDFVTVRDYVQAIRDIDRALALTPDLAVAYLLRAQAGYRLWQTDRVAPADKTQDALTRNSLSRKALDDVLADLTKVLDLSPRMAEAWYDKAIVHLEQEDYTSALSALNKAIELKPEMGEAWYNRGYVYLKLGNQRLGVADLSRAGELGIIPAYNLIKRMTN